MQTVLKNMKTHLMTLAVGLACGLNLCVFRASAELEVSAGVAIHANSDFYEPLTPHSTGLELVPTDVAGVPPESPPTGGRIATALGNGRTTAGIGSAMNRGRGLVTITAHGIMIPITAGSGFPALNGRRAGSIGASAAVTSDGFPARRPGLSSRRHFVSLSRTVIFMTTSDRTLSSPTTSTSSKGQRRSTASNARTGRLTGGRKKWS